MEAFVQIYAEIGDDDEYENWKCREADYIQKRMCLGFIPRIGDHIKFWDVEARVRNVTYIPQSDSFEIQCHDAKIYESEIQEFWDDGWESTNRLWEESMKKAIQQTEQP